MNITTNDLPLKLVYVAILAGLVLAFTSPMHLASAAQHSAAATSVAAR